MKCNNCGKKIRINDEFCSHCGNKINWIEGSASELPEEVKETRSKKASKWFTLGVTAAIGIAAVFTIAIVGNTIQKNITTDETDVAEETDVPETTAVTTQPTTTTTTQPATTQTRSNRYYNNDDDYDYDANYADGWRRANDDFEGDGTADDVWDYLRTRGYEIRDSFERGQEGLRDSLENIRNQFN